MAFKKVAAFLRLGNKYDFQQSRSEALRRLKREYPVGTYALNDLLGRRSWKAIEFEDGLHHDVFNLARETGCLYLLTTVFLTMVGNTDNCLQTILEGAERADGSVASLSSEDQKICILGVERLRVK